MSRYEACNILMSKEFRKFIKEHEYQLSDETVQKLLLYMCKKRIYAKYISDNLLRGFAKQAIETKAPYNVDISLLDFGEDKSKKLSNGETVREKIINELTY